MGTSQTSLLGSSADHNRHVAINRQERKESTNIRSWGSRERESSSLRFDPFMRFYALLISQLSLVDSFINTSMWFRSNRNGNKWERSLTWDNTLWYGSRETLERKISLRSMAIIERIKDELTHSARSMSDRNIVLIFEDSKGRISSFIEK